MQSMLPVKEYELDFAVYGRATTETSRVEEDGLIDVRQEKNNWDFAIKPDKNG